MDCSDFVARFTDYVDGAAPSEDLRAMEEHLSRCGSCRRYKGVVEHGASVLRSLPPPELKEDFEPRLQHRLYHVQEERALPEQVASRTPALTVVGIAVLLTAVAWSPLLRGDSPVVQLEPIVVDRAPITSPPRSVSAPTPPESLGREDAPDLDGRLWDDTRLYEYSRLSRRYEDVARTHQVGFGPGR